MPLYYFDYNSKQNASTDDVRTELTDLRAAKAEAVCAAADWLKDNASEAGAELCVSVRDGQAEPLCTVTALVKVNDAQSPA